jgi:hypothetical protein
MIFVLSRSGNRQVEAALQRGGDSILITDRQRLIFRRLRRWPRIIAGHL